MPMSSFVTDIMSSLDERRVELDVSEMDTRPPAGKYELKGSDEEIP